MASFVDWSSDFSGFSDDVSLLLPAGIVVLELGEDVEATDANAATPGITVPVGTGNGPSPEHVIPSAAEEFTTEPQQNWWLAISALTRGYPDVGFARAMFHHEIQHGASFRVRLVGNKLRRTTWSCSYAITTPVYIGTTAS